MSLARYITRRNLFTKTVNPHERLLDIDQLTDEDMQQLAEQIAFDLLPESLTADGTIYGAAVANRRGLLNKAATELRQMGQEISL